MAGFLSASIDCTLPSSKTSISGVKICEHFVLTHGSLVWGLFEEFIKEKENSKYRKTITNYDNSLIEIQNNFRDFINLSNPIFTVVLPTQSFDVNIKNYKVSDFIYMKKNVEENGIEGSDKSLEPVVYSHAFLEHVFIPPKLLSEFFELFSEIDMWNFDKDDIKAKDVKTKTNPFIDIYLCSFLLLRIKDGCDLTCCIKELENLYIEPVKGATLFIDGCPFGGGLSRPVFLNSLSKGIISNIGHHRNIFLTDARCILGCEGSPGYMLDKKVGLCGIVLSPFCWFRGEWIGLTIMSSLKPLLQCMKDCMAFHKSSGPGFLTSHEGEKGKPLRLQYTLEKLCSLSKIQLGNQRLTESISHVQKAIVRIICSNSVDWGSGFLVDSEEGMIVITCAHVIKEIKNKVKIVFHNGDEETGRIIFCTQPYEEQIKWKNSVQEIDIWDIAIIKLRRKREFSLRLTSAVPLLGTELLIGGHPIFKDRELNAPTFTMGILSKILSVPRNLFRNLNDSANSDLVNNLYDKYSVKFGGNSSNEGSMPVIMQTTCAVYSGISGGPVIAFDPAKGPLVVGIVSSCARDTKNEVSFPHVNMAVPTCLLNEALDKYRILGVEALQILNFRPKAAVSLWTSFSAKSKL